MEGNIEKELLDPPTCLGEGTLILTNNGYVPVEQLKEGDQIISDDYQLVPIKKVGQFKYSGKLYTIPKGYHKDRPYDDLVVSKNHKYRINGHWRSPKKYFVGNKVTDKFIYHVELEDNTKNLVANGMVVESWVVTRGAL